VYETRSIGTPGQIYRSSRSTHNQVGPGNFANISSRMGGPKAWKEMQQRQKEFQNGWDTEPQPQQPDSDDEDAQDVEKRDLYAEYGIDPETANEKEARGGSSPIEDEGSEDVRTCCKVNTQRLTCTGVYYSDDASES
jgi:hypothetical protein